MNVSNAEELMALGQRIGEKLRGGEVIEMVGDVGAGKTTMTKGIALGMGVDDDVQSPSFTISRVYPARGGLTLNHYDFYRLQDAGIMQMELAEALGDSRSVTVVEWGDSVKGVLPSARAIIVINQNPDGVGRSITIDSPYSSIKGAVA